MRLKVDPETHYSTPSAALLLVRNGLGLKAAHIWMNKLVDTNDVVVELPNVVNLDELVTELKAVGIEAHRHSVEELDPKAVRQRSGLSQKDFALRYGLDAATVRNWEQNRSTVPAAARVLLTTIDRYPEAVSAAIEAVTVMPKRRSRVFMSGSLAEAVGKGKRYLSIKEAKAAAKKQALEKKKVSPTRKGRGDRGRRFQESA